MSKVVKALGAALMLCLAAPAAHAGSGGSQVGRPAWSEANAGAKLDISGYTLAFNDEFDTLKATNYLGLGPWYAPVHANMSLGALQSVPSEVYSTVYGVLHMRTIGSGTTWKTGNLQTVNAKGQGFAIQNGYFEVRAKMPAGYGSWSAIWLLSYPKDASSTHAEIDVIEYYGKEDHLGIHSTSHVWPAASPAGGEHWWVSDYTKKDGLATAFHTYGVLVNATDIIIYVDGLELKRIGRTAEQQVPLYLLLSNFMNSASTRLDPGDMQVDYVRVYAASGARNPAADSLRTADALSVVAPASAGAASRVSAPRAIAVAAPASRARTPEADEAQAPAGPSALLTAMAALQALGGRTHPHAD